LGERNEAISKDFKILKKNNCKGGAPALLTIRIRGKPGEAPPVISEMEQRQGGEGQTPKLYTELMEQKDEY